MPSPEEVPIIFLLLNPVLTFPAPGPAVTSVTDTPSVSSPVSLFSQGNANSAADDEDDIWLAMAMTFNDLYQGLMDDNALTEVNDANTSANNDNDITDSSPLFANDDQLEDCRNLFSIPFRCGFRRIIDIDQAGNKTVSYVAPDKITQLESHEAMEQFLDQNPNLEFSTSQFGWVDLILGFKQRP